MSKHAMLMTRREFLARGLGFAALAATAPTFLNATARAAEALGGLAAKDAPILVVIQLSGGNDGLNTVVPFGHDAYYRARPGIGIKADAVLKLTDEIGLHPNLAGFKSLYDQGLLSIVQGIGYPNPDRSHFRSMEIWQSGIAEGYSSEGWIGKLFDHCCENKGPLPTTPSAAIDVSQTLNPALLSTHGVGIAVDNAERFYRMTQMTMRGKKQAPEGDSQLDFLRRTAMNAQLSAGNLRAAVNRAGSRAEYPGTALGRDLQFVAKMIAGGMETRVYYVSLGGFDTHANQAQSHARLMTELGDAVAAFVKDLGAQGLGKQVLGMTFSEFGRRVKENGTGGTDHGQAAPLFLFGEPVKGGLVGAHPSLDKLRLGDLAFHTDFRQVYATILQDWLKVPAKAVLGADYQRLPILG